MIISKNRNRGWISPCARSNCVAADYIKLKLDPDWGNAEIAKPFAERHPTIQWYHTYTHYQHETIKREGIASTDLFVVPRLRLSSYLRFQVLRDGRRRLVWYAVTTHPMTEWLARQIKEAFPWKAAPKAGMK